MNNIYLLALIFAMNINPYPSKELKMLWATTQKCVGANPKNGSGINYRILLKVKRGSRRLKFTKLWINNKEMNFTVLKDQDTSSNTRFKRNDSVYIVAGYFDKTTNIDRSYADSASKTTLNPAIPSGDAVLEYKIGRKMKFLTIEKFSPLKNMVIP